MHAIGKYDDDKPLDQCRYHLLELVADELRLVPLSLVGIACMYPLVKLVGRPGIIDDKLNPLYWCKDTQEKACVFHKITVGQAPRARDGSDLYFLNHSVCFFVLPLHPDFLCTITNE